MRMWCFTEVISSLPLSATSPVLVPRFPPTLPPVQIILKPWAFHWWQFSVFPYPMEGSIIWRFMDACTWFVCDRSNFFWGLSLENSPDASYFQARENYRNQVFKSIQEWSLKKEILYSSPWLSLLPDLVLLLLELECHSFLFLFSWIDSFVVS